jgi:tripartite-type tricarboxylate transporter receptor subunit TctC
MQVGVVAALCAFTVAVWAQPAPYPNKAIRLIIPFPAGGGADIIARVIAQKLTENVGQPTVIDNRGGGGGNIAAELAAKAPPDGYTVLIAYAGIQTVNPKLYSKLPYNAEKDFRPVTLLVTVPNVLGVHPSVPARSVQELIALAKNNPGRLNFGSSGNGTSGHLATELLKVTAGIHMVHVPYKGAGPALTGLLSGEVDFLITNVSVLMPMIKAGRVRALAVASLKRSPLLPNLPTFAESGLPGFDADSWYGAIVPAETPTAVVATLHAELVKALRAPEVTNRLLQEGAEPVGNTPQEFAERIRADSAKWAKVIEAAKVRVD